MNFYVFTVAGVVGELVGMETVYYEIVLSGLEL
jgi:hypothetical protein